MRSLSVAVAVDERRPLFRYDDEAGDTTKEKQERRTKDESTKEFRLGCDITIRATGC